jgi:hypothetical protein
VRIEDGTFVRVGEEALVGGPRVAATVSDTAPASQASMHLWRTRRPEQGNKHDSRRVRALGLAAPCQVRRDRSTLHHHHNYCRMGGSAEAG